MSPWRSARPSVGLVTPSARPSSRHAFGMSPCGDGCTPIGQPSAAAAAQNGSYSGWLSFCPSMYAAGRIITALAPEVLDRALASRRSPPAGSCNGTSATG